MIVETPVRTANAQGKFMTFTMKISSMLETDWAGRDKMTQTYRCPRKRHLDQDTPGSHLACHWKR